MLKLLHRPWTVYVVVLASVAAAVPLRLLLDAQLGVRAPALPFFFAIVASAWIGGFAPGVLATLLSVVAVQLFVGSPLWGRADNTVAALVMIMFIASGVIVSALCEIAYRQRAVARRHKAFIDDQLLRVSGYEVDTASDGLQALEVASRFRPDVVLMDLGMPKMDGYTAAERMRAEPWGRHVKLIALTGWGQDADRRRSRDAGFDRHLVKPVDAKALSEALLQVG